VGFDVDDVEFDEKQDAEKTQKGGGPCEGNSPGGAGCVTEVLQFFLVLSLDVLDGQLDILCQ